MKKHIITVFFGTCAQETKEKTYNYCVFEQLLRRPRKKRIITVLFWNICLGDQAQETKDEFRGTTEKWGHTNLNPYIMQRKNPYQLKLFGE